MRSRYFLLFLFVLLISPALALEYSDPSLPKLTSTTTAGAGTTVNNYYTTNGSGNATNWSLYPAVSNVNINNKTLINVGNYTQTGLDVYYSYVDDTEFYWNSGTRGKELYSYLDPENNAVDFLTSIVLASGNQLRINPYTSYSDDGISYGYPPSGETHDFSISALDGRVNLEDVVFADGSNARLDVSGDVVATGTICDSVGCIGASVGGMNYTNLALTNISNNFTQMQNMSSLRTLSGSLTSVGIGFQGVRQMGFYKDALERLIMVANSSSIGNFSSNKVLSNTGTLTATSIILDRRIGFSSYIRDSIFGIAGQANQDLTLSGLYDRNELSNAYLKNGNVTIKFYNNVSAVTGTINNDLFDSNAGTWLSLGNINSSASTEMEIIVDMGEAMPNYGSTFFQPFVQYRLDTWENEVDQAAGGSFFNCVNVTVANATYGAWVQPSANAWYTNNLNNESQAPGLWLGKNGVITIGSSRYRYVRFYFSCLRTDSSYSSRSSMWIPEIGLRHFSGDYARQFLKKSGDSVYGNLNMSSMVVSYNITNANMINLNQLKLNIITLPTCSSGTLGTIAANSTGPYYCNSTTWNRMTT